MARSKLLVAVSALLMYATPLDAQIPDSIPAGARLRITDSSGRTITGNLVASDTVVVLRSPERRRSFSVPMADVQRVEVSVGEQRDMFRYTFFTSAISAGALGTWAAATWEPCAPKSGNLLNCKWASDSRSDEFLVGAAVGAVLGVPVGLLLGIAMVQDVWRDLAIGSPAVPKPSLGVTPTPGGIGVAASIAVGRR
jgi:hypothetical protein